MRKSVREHGKVVITGSVTEMFMWFKQSQGLAPRTIEEYRIHFQWLMDYLGKDLTNEKMTVEVDFMLND